MTRVHNPNNGQTIDVVPARAEFLLATGWVPADPQAADVAPPAEPDLFTVDGAEELKKAQDIAAWLLAEAKAELDDRGQIIGRLEDERDERPTEEEHAKLVGLVDELGARVEKLQAENAELLEQLEAATTPTEANGPDPAPAKKAPAKKAPAKKPAAAKEE